MGTMQSARYYGVCTALALLVGLFLYQPVAYGESYIAGQFGVALPSIGKGLTNIDTTTTFVPGTTVSDLGLKSSAFYGIKAGHYFRSSPWFGIEAEFFGTTPHVKEQTHTFNAPGGVTASANLPGAHLRVLTLAPANLMFRYHKTRLQPYFGIGPGLFFAKLSSSDVPNTQSDNWRLGLNAKAGLEYYITRRVSVFGEYKFNYARFNFPNDSNAFPFPYGFNATYKMHLVGFGLSIHF